MGVGCQTIDAGIVCTLFPPVHASCWGPARRVAWMGPLLEMGVKPQRSQRAWYGLASTSCFYTNPKSLPTFISSFLSKSLLPMHRLLLDCSTLTSKLTFKFL